MRTAKNPDGHKIPVYTREDLHQMNMRRRDAMMSEIWPVGRRPPVPKVFYFDPGDGDLRPSVLVRLDNLSQPVRL